jgi:large subunit ribosomal protein L25
VRFERFRADYAIAILICKGEWSNSMEEIILNAELRNITGKAVKRLRREGSVPAVVYGHHTEPVSLRIHEGALRQALKEAGATRLITLNVAGLKGSKRVLVRELQRDAISLAMLHVDLYEVIMTERISAQVPVVLIGESPPVVNGEGILVQGLNTIEIESLPGDLPPSIEVNLAELTFIDDAVLVRDLKLSDAVEVLADPEEAIVRILPLEEEEIEEVVVEEVPEVEVVGEEEPAPEAEAEEEAPSQE